MKVVVIGAGYVGLVTALGLARIGHQIVCVEKNPQRLETLRRGDVFFYEPGIVELLSEVRLTGRFAVTDDLDEALVDAEVVMIAVGTPSKDSGIDVSDVRQAAADVGARLPLVGRYVVVAVKSTVVPGTTDGIVRKEIEQASSMPLGQFGLAVTPEFLREGSAVADFLEPDRIVIGASDDRAGGIIGRVFEGFACPVLRTNLRNAEMIKYVSNAVLACLVSFSNEVSRICERFEGLNEETVMYGLHLDRRFWVPGADGKRLAPQLVTYLRGGVGYGGSCFPKDVQALEKFERSLGLEPHLFSAIRTINELRATDVIRLLETKLRGPVKSRRIAVLGLAFKPDTDDTRESAGLRIAAELGRRGADVVAHDPMVTEKTLHRDGSITLALAPSLTAALVGAHAAIIATSWQEYKTADWPALTRIMHHPLVLDGRQVIQRMQRGRDFVYAATGTLDEIGPN
jgi:UDPglucose 6-dehydrogenase/GDP-mannose 6-dehydrogenase